MLGPTSPKKLLSNKNYEACASFFVTQKHTDVENTGKTRSFAGILELDDRLLSDWYTAKQ